MTGKKKEAQRFRGPQTSLGLGEQPGGPATCFGGEDEGAPGHRSYQPLDCKRYANSSKRTTVRARSVVVAVLLCSSIGLSPPQAAAEDWGEEARREMVETIRAIATEVGPIGGRSVISETVLEAMAAVPRHRFVPDEIERMAYQDRPLPIGYGQTISQPYIVALMTDILNLQGDETVLEVGTGSGYQAAVCGRLAARTYTMEIVPELATRSANTLTELGFDTVVVRQGDGYYGWPEHAPFDAIIVTAAASHVPPPLIDQLKPGGRMVIPVGGPFLVQQLLRIDKAADGTISTRQLLPVRFVPLTGGH